MDYQSDQSKNVSPLPSEQGGPLSLFRTPASPELSTGSGLKSQDRTNAGTFAPGNSLSKGRKKGSKNKNTILREKLERKNTKLLTTEVPDVVRKALELAKEGDKQAMKLVLDEVHRLHVRAQDNSGSGQVIVSINIGTLDEENMGEVLAGDYAKVED